VAVAIITLVYPVATSFVLCSGVAEPGENEEKEPAVAAGDNMDTVNQEDGDSLFRVPVVAPALKNLGILCFYFWPVVF